MLVTTLPLNYYTTSMMLQQVMEKPLEKKAGKTYGPPGTKKLVYFIDDMNMPEVDTYGTVQPHTLIRQVSHILNHVYGPYDSPYVCCVCVSLLPFSTWTTITGMTVRNRH